MNYKIAIYTTDYLLLLELSSVIETEFPDAQVTVFGDDALEESVDGSDDGYVLKDFARIHESDVLIILSDPKPIHSEAVKFEGTIIDATGGVFPPQSEVFQADEPIRGVLKNIAVPVSDVSAVVQLPVCVFGKDGVEDLMRQTKEIFSFEETDNLFFENRIAFNVHFNPENLSGFTVGKSIDAFAEAGGDINVRIGPLSTVFILDVYAKDSFVLKNDDGYKIIDGFFTLSDVSEVYDIFVIIRRNGYTFIGDYIRILVRNVVKKLNEVIG